MVWHDPYSSVRHGCSVTFVTETALDPTVALASPTGGRKLALRDFRVSGLVTRHARNGISDVQRETSWGPGSG
jgi:hypothetical protein